MSAKNARINYSYGEGVDTVFFSYSTGRLFASETDREELHQLFGGVPYYSSWTKLHGAGFIQPSLGQNDLVEFGWYRTDARFQQSDKVVHILPDYRQIYGYAPIASHAGVVDGFPVVLTDGYETVAFIMESEILKTLRDWDKVVVQKARELTQLVYTGDLDNIGEVEVKFRLYNPHKLPGVNAFRFVCHQWQRTDKDSFWGLNLEPPTVCKALGLIQGRIHSGNFHDGFVDTAVWLRLAPGGYFDRQLTSSPHEIEGEICGNWLGDGHGLIWRRIGDTQIEAIMEKCWSEMIILFPAENLEFPNAPAWVSVEETISCLEWFSLDDQGRQNRLLKALFAKAKEWKKDDVELLPTRLSISNDELTDEELLGSAFLSKLTPTPKDDVEEDEDEKFES